MQDDRINGINGDVALKPSARAATTANIVLSGLQTVDGVSLASGDRVLVKNQTNSIENGIYIADTSAWQRSTDFNGSYDAIQGTLVPVYAGTDQSGSIWKLDTSDPVIGTSALNFTKSNPTLPELAASTGASLIGAAGGGTVQDYLADGYQIINVDHPPYSGDLVAAWGAIAAGGKYVLKLGKRTYNILDLPDNTKPHVAFIGSGVPAYDYTNQRLIENSGTILQGSLYNNAVGFHVSNLGIDRGEWVRTNMAGDVYRDTFVNYNFGTDANIRYGDLIVVQSEAISGDATTYTHCILTELGSGVYQTGPVEVIDGYHGHVIKVTDFFGGQDTIARYQFADAMILKSDAAALCKNVTLGNVIIDGDNTRTSAGVLFEAQTQTLSGITIGSIVARNAQWVFTEAAATNTSIVGVHIGFVSGSVIDGTGGATQAAVIGANAIDFTIGAHQFNACVKGGIHVASGAVNVDIGHGFSKNSSTGDGYKFDDDASHGKLVAIQNTGYGVRNNGNALLNAADVECIANTAGGISAVTTLSAPLQNGWTDTGGTFRVVPYGNEVRISGNLTGGSIGAGYAWLTVAQISNRLPVFDEILSCAGYTAGGVTHPLGAKITSAGDIQVYGMGAQATAGIFLSGSYVAQGNY
jgi:hypothetical protein